ncbi:collagen alpha-2(I) chain-like [Hetaerina americana]|uniref:collagen alpha-2(I) chain-like n=1 Tax=Hetaerina americana TaxID=62018 RepID=UPI003A7F622B
MATGRWVASSIRAGTDSRPSLPHSAPPGPAASTRPGTASPFGVRAREGDGPVASGSVEVSEPVWAGAFSPPSKCSPSAAARPSAAGSSPGKSSPGEAGVRSPPGVTEARGPGPGAAAAFGSAGGAAGSTSTRSRSGGEA